MLNKIGIEIIRLENAISLVSLGVGLPELYVELIVCPSVSETFVRVIYRKALT